jgi:hypothetical protein
MPKMKGLKDLMLPVGNENETGGYGCASRVSKRRGAQPIRRFS